MTFNNFELFRQWLTAFPMILRLRTTGEQKQQRAKTYLTEYFRHEQHYLIFRIADFDELISELFAYIFIGIQREPFPFLRSHGRVKNQV